MANTAGGNHSFDVPVGGVRFLTFFRAGDLLSADPGAFGDVRDEPLGTKRIAGVETTGRRITIVVPPGSVGTTGQSKWWTSAGNRLNCSC